MALRRIMLRDFVIVQALDLELHGGFTVLTGETGAGKSILIDALQLLLGARCDAGVVRETARQAELCAEFDPPPPASPLHHWLDGHGFIHTDGPPRTGAADQPEPLSNPPSAPPPEPLLLRRTIDTQGRSRAWINGSPATATQLRHLGAALVDIHGQHAWHSLMQPEAMRGLLDAYATHALAHADMPALLRQMQHSWQAWQDSRSALATARAAQEAARQESERLLWQIAEVEKLNPRPGEWAALNAEHTRLSRTQTLQQAAQQALHLVQAEGAARALHRACAVLQDNAGAEPRFLPIAEEFGSSLAQLEDACHSLNAWLRHAEHDPARLAELDERLSWWMQLARRWRCPPEELPDLLQRWQDEWQRLSHLNDLDPLRTACRQARACMQQTAQRLHECRAQAAPRLAAAITQAMQGLGMAGGRFEVRLDSPALRTGHEADAHAGGSGRSRDAARDTSCGGTAGDAKGETAGDASRNAAPDAASPAIVAGAHGIDSVQFLVAAHPGATPRPIGRVASGGELSRLSLAIAVTTSELGSTPTLIFDEVDSGIGGAVAETVGRLMRSLGQHRQVLAVTHLPQVAACAQWHCVVTKQRGDGVQALTTSTVQALPAEGRTLEIARMLGGEKLSATTLAHAREMLDSAWATAPEAAAGASREAPQSPELPDAAACASPQAATAPAPDAARRHGRPPRRTGGGTGGGTGTAAQTRP